MAFEQEAAFEAALINLLTENTDGSRKFCAIKQKKT